MTQQDDSPAAPESADNAGSAAESGAATAKPGNRRSGGALGGLALVLAALACAGIGWLWFVGGAGDLNSRLDGIESGIERNRRSADRMAADIDAAAAAAKQAESQLAALDKRNRDTGDEVAARLQRLEGTVDSMSGIAADVRSAWLRSETEYFLRIANVQLNLAGNVEAAAKALDLADEVLEALADPQLTPVRAKLNDERAALAAVPRPDTEGIVLKLGSLSRSLDAMPLVSEAPEQFGNRRSGGGEETGLARAWRVIVDALSSIISVKRDDDIAPLMSQADESMLIRSLDLELQIARLALIRNDSDTFFRSLQAATDRMRRYFDATDPGVAAALDTLNALEDTQLPAELPDISGSLTLLRRIGNEP